jgi:hypothetical protein
MSLGAALAKFDLKDRRLLLVNACVSVPLLLLLLGLSAYFFARGETSNGSLLLGIGVAFLVAQTVSFTVLTRRGTFRSPGSR